MVMVGRGIFESLKDPEKFDTVYIDPESHTIAWPGGIDLCPHSLYEEISGKNILKPSNA